jgi:hypothetical protein
VGIAPANAATTSFDVEVTGAGGNGDTAATALTHAALESNDLSGTLVEFDINGTIAGTSFTASATGGVKLIEEVTDEDGEYLPLSAGKTSIASTKYGAKSPATAADKTFFAYTTSTTPGKVTITSSTGASEVYFVASDLGQAYNVSVTMPSSVPVADEGTSKTGARVYLVVTDVFGNAFDDLAANDSATSGADGTVELDAIGATIEVTTVWTYDTKRKAFKNDLGIVSSRSGNVAITVELMGDPDLTDYGFKAAKTTAFGTVSVKSLEDQVAALQAQLANTVSKAKYNNLVVKYNKITRGKKAKLVK